jgi:hypothetical protein
MIDLILQKKIRKKQSNSFPEYDSSYWVLKNPSGKGEKLYINRISSSNVFNKNKFFILDFYFFIEKNNDFLSFTSLQSYVSSLKVFLSFLNENYPEINEFSDIDYNILISYSHFLQSKKNNKTKYGQLILFLRALLNLDANLINKDIIEGKIPNLKFKENKTKREYYSEKDFEVIVKTIIYFINKYFKESDSVEENVFVKFSYWLLASCIGFNKTGLNSLTVNSIEEIEKNKFLIVGEKNRSTKGYQNITLNLEKNNLILKVIIELKRINNQNANKLNDNYKNTLFPLYNHNRSKENNISEYISYDGNINFLEKGTKTRQEIDLISNNNFVMFSTLKIRNSWSNKVFDISKSESIASKMLNHKKATTTTKHYLNKKISNVIQKKFLLFQEILFCYSENKEFDKWIEFQNAFNIKNKNNEILIKEINNGVFQTFVGNCMKQDSNVCRSYLQCFKCQNYSIIGDKDLWKVLSFKELLKSKNNKIEYQNIINSIEEIIENFDEKILNDVKSKYQKLGLHPFFKNEVVFKKIIEDYERSLIND